MDLFRSMEVFTAVVECGSFNRAAKAQQISPAMASTHISRLEEHLGARLISRTTRMLSLTEEGEAYYARCRRILADVTEAEAALAGAAGGPRGHLRVEVAGPIAKHLLVPVLGSFCARYPEITLELIQTEHVSDSTYEGFDVMLRLGPFQDSNLVARPISRMKVLTVASPDYLKRHAPPRRPQDLERHRCLVFIHPHTGRLAEWIFERSGATLRLPLKGYLTFNQAEPRIEAALRGLGVTQSTFSDIAAPIREGKLRVVLEDWIADGPQLFIVHPKHRHMPQKVRAFVDFVLEQYPPGVTLGISGARGRYAI